jgi:hypothetical protein
MSKSLAILTDKDYQGVLARIDMLMGAQAGTPAGEELDTLVNLVELYEAQHHPMSDLEARAMPCEACEGTGRRLYWRHDHDGSEYATKGVEPCLYCDGTGVKIITVEPIEEDELP